MGLKEAVGGTFQGVGCLLWVAVGAADVVGIIHTCRHHSAGDAVCSIVLPPWGVYRGAESLWHDAPPQDAPMFPIHSGMTETEVRAVLADLAPPDRVAFGDGFALAYPHRPDEDQFLVAFRNEKVALFGWCAPDALPTKK